MNFTDQTKLCMVIGHPVGHSLSPVMHNAGYAALRIENQYVYLAANVHPEELKTFTKAIKIIGMRGISCTSPHKIEVMQYLDRVDPLAQRIGAVNTIVNENDVLKGYNTDWLGIVIPLEKRLTLKGRKVALIGAGGAARAAAYGLAKRNATLTIYNRTLSKAENLAHEFGGTASPLDQLTEIQKADIIINAISTNASQQPKDVPAFDQFITPNHIVFDIVYSSRTSPLLKKAEQRGATIIDGVEMLLHQGTAQFELFTGHKAPESAMHKALLAAARGRE